MDIDHHNVNQDCLILCYAPKNRSDTRFPSLSTIQQQELQVIGIVSVPNSLIYRVQENHHTTLIPLTDDDLRRAVYIPLTEIDSYYKYPYPSTAALEEKEIWKQQFIHAYLRTDK